MKYKGGIISIAVLLTIGLCSFTGAKTTTETYSNNEIEEYAASDYTRAQYFEHKIDYADDFQNNGGTSGGTTAINGLTWTFSSSSFMGADSKGVQIGSSKNPQTSDWDFSTSFGETVLLTGLELKVINASGGNATATIKVGSTTVGSGTFSNNSDYTTFSYSDLEIETSSLTITLKASSSAMYFYSLSFSIRTTANSTLTLSEDSYDAEPVTPGTGDIPKTNYSPLSDYSSYYSGLDLTATGDDLKSILHNKIYPLPTQVNYGDARYDLQYTDESIDTPGYMYGAFDGDLIRARWDSGGTWNREHIWPQSKLGASGDLGSSTKDQRTDLHVLRVACSTSNGYKSNKYYDNTQGTNTFYPNLVSGDISGEHNFTGDFRGDVARICFYMYVMYGSTVGLDLSDSSSAITSGSSTFGLKSVLIEWALEDEPDEFEIQRNNRIYEYQGNRNPFIDYPELVSQLFEIDSGEDLDPITINVDSSYSVIEGQTVNLNVTTDPSNAALTYTSSDTSVATVNSSGVVTGVNAGTAAITITASLDGYQTTSVTTSVTVNEMPSVSFTLDFDEFTVMEEHSQIVEFASVNPSNATMSLESSDTSVFTVSKEADWYIYGVAPGSATLYVTVSADGYKSVTESVPVTITEMPTASVTFNKASFTIEEGEREDISFTTSYKNVTVSFTSSDPSVAQVLYDENYYIQTYQPGSVTITATINATDCRTGTQTLEVTVTSHPTISVTFDQPSYSVNNGESVYVSLTTNPNDALIELTFDETGIEVIKEDDAYKVTGLVPGTYPLTATASKEKYYSGSATTYITVIDTSLSEITINWDASSYTLDEGDIITFNVSTEPRDGVTLVVSSENEEIAKVTDNNDGSYTLSGLTPGTTNIYALAYGEGFNNAIKVVSVTVNEVVPPEPERGTITLSFNRDSYITKVGDRMVISTTVDPSDATVTYSIEDTSIADLTLLEDGNWAIIGLKEGTTTLTATASLEGYESVSVSITLNVEASDLPIEPDVTEPGPEEESGGLSNGAIAAIIIVAAIVVLAIIIIPIIVHHSRKKKAI